MFFIPAWISNILLMITVYLAGFQHVQMKRPNPVANLQFVMIAFALAMIVIIALYNRENPWLSLAFFAIAVGSLLLMIRQMRTLPPIRTFE
jgi:predicted membrane channel-forming protein YqfA (hemolysin III family)